MTIVHDDTGKNLARMVAAMPQPTVYSQNRRGIAFGIFPTYESVNKACACPLPTVILYAEAVFDPHNRRILYIISHLGDKKFQM